MLVNFYVIQKNEKEETQNLLLTQRDVPELRNGELILIDDVYYMIVLQDVERYPYSAFCHEFKKPKNDTKEEDTTSGYSEKDTFF